MGQPAEIVDDAGSEPLFEVKLEKAQEAASSSEEATCQQAETTKVQPTNTPNAGGNTEEKK